MMTISTFSRALRGGALIAAIGLGTVALSASDASAQYRRHGGGGWGPGVAAGVLGGVAAGAIIAGAANPYPYSYSPAPVYAPPPGGCWYEPEDVWNGYRWVRRRVRVCE